MAMSSSTKRPGNFQEGSFFFAFAFNEQRQEISEVGIFSYNKDLSQQGFSQPHRKSRAGMTLQSCPQSGEGDGACISASRDAGCPQSGSGALSPPDGHSQRETLANNLPSS